MGNCPSGLTCDSGQKKICFRDMDDARTKHGFCLNESNLNILKKISTGAEPCPDCPPLPPPCPDCPPLPPPPPLCTACPPANPPPPQCPIPGSYFLGKNLGNIDEQMTIKNYLTHILETKQGEFCSTFGTDINTMVTELLSVGRVDFDITDETPIAFDTYILDSRAYVSDNPLDTETNTSFLDFMESHKLDFSTEENLDISKFTNFIDSVGLLVCTPPTQPIEGYTGKFSKNSLLNFIILLILLVILHFLIHK